MEDGVKRSSGDGGTLRGGVHKTLGNNEKFNQMLNASSHPRRIVDMLMLIKPSIEQPNDVAEKRKVIVGNLFSGLDVAQRDEQVV